ncbi:MAG: 23S rRNA (uracil(1939)-C(5))-methyltransferase RlmD [Oscillospiraceae bacterium]
MLKKNDIITLEITGMTNEGNGVGRHEGIAVFVPLTAVGDVISCRIVKVQKSFCYGICSEIIKPSSSRCDSGCQVYSKCGGCSFRHFSYSEELRIKEDFVKSSFERIGKIFAPSEPILGAGDIDEYRNKAQYPVAEQDGKVICGFYAKRSHRVIEYTRCRLQPKIFGDIADDIIAFMNSNKVQAYNEQTGKGLVRHIYLRRGQHSGEIMLCFIVTSIKKSNELKAFAPLISARYPDVKSIVLNENPKNTNVIMGDKTEVIWGSDVISDTMCGNNITLSPKSFYQVNTIQAEKLYALAEEYADLSKDDILLDLYCGAGTIGLSMASKVKKLIGVEIIPSAIENAKDNAKANEISNSEFICGDAGQIARLLFERGERPSVIIADPARKGCDRTSLGYMAKMSPDRIVMISCNHTTAARDCAIMGELGYRVEKYRAVDLFPRTTHVESVVLMSRKDK